MESCNICADDMSNKTYSRHVAVDEESVSTWKNVNGMSAMNSKVMQLFTSTSSALLEDERSLLDEENLFRTASNSFIVSLVGNSTDSNATQDDYVDDEFLDSFVWSPDLLWRYSPSVSAVYCIAYTLVFILGIIGNSFVVAVVVRSPRMRTVTNYFIVNLALADILVLLFCLPATLLSNLFTRK